ncbi:MAG: hypothetical protein Q9210_003481 [Variospora velana]
MAEALYDDEDDDLWIEDPYDEADDLAEHTMHSPVLVNYDPALESAEVWTDWDDYSDDFFDSESPRPERRKINTMGNAQAAAAKPKRRKRKSSGNFLEFSLGEPASSNDERLHPRPQPTVVWKSRGDSPKLPIIRQGQEEKVSILKDWRSRIKPSPRSSDTKFRTSDGSQRAIAVVIQHTNHTQDSNAISPRSYSSKRKRYRDDEDPISTSEPGSEHKNGPTTKKKRKQITPPSAADDNTPTPVLMNGISQRTKRKRKLEAETDEQTSPKRKKDARGTPPEKPSNKAETRSDDDQHERKTTLPNRKRTQANTDLEPIPTQSPSGKAAAAKGTARGKAAATATGRRSMRRR